jgi:hypothetical protein
MHIENGEQILVWTAARQLPGGNQVLQRIQCTASRNRLQWTFLDFFSAPDDMRQLTLSLSSVTAVIPQAWSHHLIRFDADTGLFEYLLNGRLEEILYATSTGREGGEVYTPRTGEGGRLVLGGRFTGLIDEFRIYSRNVETPALQKYPGQGGRMETRSLDLGEGNSSVIRVEAAGGRTSTPNGAVQNEYAGTGRFRFADDSALQFFIRTSDSPYQWATDGSDWIPFEPGTELSGNIRGRYVQIKVQFYPSGDGETTPYLEELRIIYQPDTPPIPPTQVTAIAGNGGVDLSWRASPDQDTAGYLVYYGTSRGEYFGSDAAQGASPINVGKRTSIHIDGLKNGTLYFFAITAYDQVGPSHGGEFSREVTARPLRTVE